MNAIYALLRLHPKTQSWGGRSAPDHGAIRPDELMAALGCLSPFRADLLMAKWLDDPEALTKVRHRTQTWLARRAVRLQWRRVTPERLERVSLVVVDEFINPRPCKRCGGRGIAAKGSVVHATAFLVVDCPTCGGIGIRGFSERQRCERAGIDRRRVWPTWRVRYESVLSYLNAEHGIALSHFARTLSEETYQNEAV